MFNFNGENDMKKPLFNQSEREQIKTGSISSVHEKYFDAHFKKAMGRAMAAAIDKDIMGMLNNLNELKERIEK